MARLTVLSYHYTIINLLISLTTLKLMVTIPNSKTSDVILHIDA